LRGVQSAAFDTRWDLMLIQESLGDPVGLLSRLKGRANGFLFLSPSDETLPTLRRLNTDGVQFLSVGSSWLDEPIPAVDTDNIQGAELAVEHLAKLGHRCIGMLGAPENMSNSRDRHEGFEAALKARGLRYCPDWFIPCHGAYAISDAERARLLAMVRSDGGPTAVFAGGYVLAVSAIEALQNEGLNVPDDLSVVGFDDKFSAAFLNPPLTTVAQPLEEMGRYAVERLEAMIGGRPSRQIVERLPTRLVVRQSTAPPRPGKT
jgi:LacI family transcriptional regulator